MKKLTIYSLLFCIIPFIFTGCNEKTQHPTIVYNTTQNISALDPQFEEESIRQDILRGLFTPLVAVDLQGEIQMAAAKDYTLSSNGLVYTFNLREDLYWSDGKNVTAYDYAFGLQRVVASVVSSYSQKYSCIATDGIHPLDDYTLQIMLISPVEDFLYSLGDTPAFPCREDFFVAQKGRYAISKTTLLTCGAFVLEEWSSSRIVLLPDDTSPLYKTSSAIVVNLKSSELGTAFMNGESSIHTIPYSQLEQFTKYDSIPLEEESHCLVVNPRHAVLGDEEVRKEIINAGIQDFSTIDLGNGGKSYGIFPPNTTVNQVNYREVVGEVYPNSVQSMDATAFGTLLSDKGMEMPQITITYSDVAPAEDFANALYRNLRNNLAIYANLQKVTEEELSYIVSSGTYDLVITPIGTSGSDYNNILSLLERMMAGEKEIEKNLQRVRLNSVEIEEVQEVEEYVMEKGLMIPLYTTTARCVYQSPVTGIQLHPYNGMLIPSGVVSRKGN